jgi:hypothetical protein
MRVRPRVAPLVAVWLFPTALAAQPALPEVGPSPVPILRSGPLRTWSEPLAPVLDATEPGVVTAASLILPGSGQLLLGQRRWAIYAAVEAVAWLWHLDRRREGRHLRTEYRDLAWLSARSAAPEPRRDGDWEYYERLEHWPTSGRFDADAARAGIQPETDVQTFNGSVWALARDIFLPGGEGDGTPAYARALDYYQQRAYPSALQWDWRGEEDSLELYRNMIDDSDRALRTSTVVLGAVVANHLLSAVDAFVSARLRRASPVTAGARLHAGPRGTSVEWRVEVR